MKPVQGVVLRAELPGTVREIAFESGRDAAAGQLLVQLDISSEQARLRSAEAQAELARLNLDRARNLRDQALISQAEYDAAEAAFRQGSGAVDDIRASIAKKTIRAPFSGRLGIRTVNLGQFVSAGDPIVSLQSLDPVFVDFSLPEQQFSLVRRDLAVRVTTDAVPGRTFTGSSPPSTPTWTPRRATSSCRRRCRTRAARCAPACSRASSWSCRSRGRFLVVPATAVLHAPYGDSVFVIADEAGDKAGSRGKQARLTTVRLGETRGDFVAVTQGLEAGQTIASSGVFKLRNGSPVVVDNTLAPDARTNPKPTDS